MAAKVDNSIRSFLVLVFLLIALPAHSFGDDAEDVGVDIAIIKSQAANLRKQSGTNAPILRTLKKGDVLVLLEREPETILGTVQMPVDSNNQTIIDKNQPLILKDTSGKGEWYNVIDIDSGVEGWVHGSLIDIHYTKERKKANIFTTEKISTIQPEVVIRNDSYKDLTLKVGNNTYVIEKHSEKAMLIDTGTFNYYASAPGVIPAIGEQTFEAGYRYSWRFWIETKRAFSIGKSGRRYKRK